MKEERLASLQREIVYVIGFIGTLLLIIGLFFDSFNFPSRNIELLQFSLIFPLYVLIYLLYRFNKKRLNDWSFSIIEYCNLLVMLLVILITSHLSLMTKINNFTNILKLFLGTFFEINLTFLFATPFFMLLILFFYQMKDFFASFKVLCFNKTEKGKVLTGNSYFDILNYFCSLPLNKISSQEDALTELNKGKRVDKNYYGLSGFEFEMLVKSGYLVYWEVNEEEKRLKLEERALLPTPKALELVEMRKSRMISYYGIGVALIIGLLSFLTSYFSIINGVTDNGPLSLLITTICVLLIGYLFLISLKHLRK